MSSNPSAGKRPSRLNSQHLSHWNGIEACAPLNPMIDPVLPFSLLVPRVSLFIFHLLYWELSPQAAIALCVLTPSDMLASLHGVRRSLHRISPPLLSPVTCTSRNCGSNPTSNGVLRRVQRCLLSNRSKIPTNKHSCAEHGQ